jgi:hypothetical protein
MKIFLAGCEQSNYIDLLKKIGHKNILVSYYYLMTRYKTDDQLIEFLSLLKNNGFAILLDSGAFTVHTKGKKINLEQYINFVNSFGIYFDRMASLDVIGNPKETLHNFEVMRARGANVFYTYHLSSFEKKQFSDLKEIVPSVDFIALGGMATGTVSHKKYKQFLDWAFAHIAGKPAHGWGLTNNVLPNYPFYSVDSTTWQNSSRYGNCLEFINGKLMRHPSPKVVMNTSRNVARINHKAMIDDKTREYYSIKAIHEFQNYLTSLWTARGIKW